MNRWILASALALCASASAAAAPATSSPGQPLFLQQPTETQFHQALPLESRNSSGRAIMRCHADGGGQLSDCHLVADTSGDAAFGKTLLSLAAAYRVNPARLPELPGGAILVEASWFEFDTPADWLRKPTGAEVLVLWPSDAARKGVEGGATISCLVNTQGAAYDCVPMAEHPADMGFGGAAVTLAQQFLFRPATLRGKPVVSTVSIPLNWKGDGASLLRGSGRPLVDAAMAWVEAPSFADLAAAYPRKAREARLAGRANIGCHFQTDGRVVNCRTLMEEPKGQGFGRAAENLGEHFLAPKIKVEGKAINWAAVQIPVSFDLSLLGDEAPQVGKPTWAAIPSADEVRAAFANIGTGGTARAVLSCIVQSGGGVGDCKVASEEPKDRGIGEAALALAPHFKMITWTSEGRPTVGARISIPVRYEGSAAPAATP